MINKVIIKSPAKINLFLDILNSREDGYHNVNMIMQSVTLFDTVIIKKIMKNKIILNFPRYKYKFLNYKNDQKKNTAFIAASEFFKFTGINNFGVNITVLKNIPICAGLAGGSSDAAAVLIGLNEMFNTNLSKAELAKIGKIVGADVPFCILGGTMLATGIGTKLKTLRHMPFCYFVLCKPNIKVSTKTAYDASDKNIHIEKNLDDILESIRLKNLRKLSNCVFNYFEEVLKLNKVDRIKYIMKQNGAMSACMSGSGPTVYGIFSNKDDALKCQQRLKTEYGDVFICQPQKFGSKIISIE